MLMISKLPMHLFLLFSAFTLMSSNNILNQPEADVSDHSVVVLTFKTQPDKGAEAVSAFTKLFEKVQKEPHFVSIKMHIDPADDTNIMLYEEWKDLEYYNTDHMSTDHMQQFMEDSRNFLMGPPEISQWKVAGMFK